MSMNKKNIIVIALGALLVIAVLIGGGFWFGKKKSASVVTEPKKQFATVEGETGYVWYPVPELGIEIKVNKDIAPELVYQVNKSQEGKDIVSVGFTTERMQKIAEKRGLTNENGAYPCPIGGFTRYNMSKQEYMAMQEEVYGEGNVTPVEVDGYFIEYGSPQSSCSPDKEDGEYESYAILNLWKHSPEDIGESLQQSIRRLR